MDTLVLLKAYIRKIVHIKANNLKIIFYEPSTSDVICSHHQANNVSKGSNMYGQRLVRWVSFKAGCYLLNINVKPENIS